MPTLAGSAAPARRNRGFEDTHQRMIDTAIELIAERGVDALSMATLARAMGINRTTVYYHFEDRDALLDAVKHWSAEQLTKGLALATPQQDRIDFITRFVLDNPELTKLWIDDFIATGDIRDRYPYWDTLVQGIAAHFDDCAPGEQRDAEVYCVILLTSAIIGPRVFRNSVDPAADTATVVERFRNEQMQLLRLHALAKEEPATP